jgi:hypothetical protein
VCDDVHLGFLVRWHIGQFFTLLTCSSELEPEPEDSLVSAEAPEDWRVG